VCTSVSAISYLEKITRKISGKINKLITTKKSRRSACMGKSELQAKSWPENLKGRGHVEEVGIDRRII
jgi:hypothetical protein